ncbi:MAG: oligosaccharide flippase family protein [Bacteroidetes bacterium]|nr:oligosaccharide flippase family protein [Bacteroidota bacterium]
MKINNILKKRSIKDIAALSGANLALRPIQFIKSFLVAKYLGPADYGLLTGVNLIRQLSKFGNLGFKAVATREVLELKGAKSSESDIKFIKNNSYSFEVVLSVLLFFAGIGSAFFFTDNILIFYAVILASTGLLFQKLQAIFSNEATINRRFGLIAKITFATGLFSAVLISILVPFLRIYASLIIPTIASILSIYFYSKNLDFRFNFVFDKKEFVRQLKIGFPISMATVAYGSYVYLEKFFVITFFGLVATGLFGFSQMILSQLVGLALMAIRVRKVNIFENIGARNYSIVNKIVLRETFFLIVISFVSIAIIWFLIDYFVPIFLPKYINAIPIAKLMLFILPFKVLSSYVAIVLISKTVNKQSIIPFIQFGSTLLLALSVYLLDTLNQLTLYSFVIADVFGYAIYHIIIFTLYFNFFYNKYVRTTNH